MGLYQNRIVVKAGTSTLMNELGKSDLRTIELLCRVLADIHNKGFEVILVSSGAIAFGVGKLGLHKAFRIEHDDGGARIVPITNIAHVRSP